MKWLVQLRAFLRGCSAAGMTTVGSTEQAIGSFAGSGFDKEDSANHFDPFTHQSQTKVRVLINRMGLETDAVIRDGESQDPIFIANANCDL